MNKQMITAAVLVMFVISAGTSSFLKKPKDKKAGEKSPASKKQVEPLTDAELASTDGDDSTPPVILRPEYIHNSQSINLLATRLKKKLTDEQKREISQKAREEGLNLIHKDFLEHQKALKVERLAMENSLADAIRRLRDAKAKYKKQLEEDGSKKNEKKSTTVSVPPDEKRMLRKLGLVFNSMPAESAASIVTRLAGEDEFDTVVKVLGTMRERDAKDVLATIEQGFERDGVDVQANPMLAAELTRRYLTLRKPTVQ